jgi:hypothetical protein
VSRPVADSSGVVNNANPIRVDPSCRGRPFPYVAESALPPAITRTRHTDDTDDWAWNTPCTPHKASHPLSTADSDWWPAVVNGRVGPEGAARPDRARSARQNGKSTGAPPSPRRAPDSTPSLVRRAFPKRGSCSNHRRWLHIEAFDGYTASLVLRTYATGACNPTS